MYRHITPSGKSYIGITSSSVDVRKRRGYRHNPFMTAAVKRYGWKNIKTEVLAENVDLDEANLLETYYIASFETQNRKLGYNICSGGMFFNSREEEIKKRISEASKGRVHSDDEKHRMRINNPRRRPIRCIDTGEIYPSIRSAAKAINGSNRGIINVADGCWKQYKGFHFEWVERNEDE